MPLKERTVKQEAKRNASRSRVVRSSMRIGHANYPDDIQNES